MAQSQLNDALRRAAAHQRALAERALADLAVTPAQFAVLQILSEQPGTSAAEVARIERLTPPTMSVIVGNLMKKRVIEKRPHRDNARIQQLSLTLSGETLVHNGIARMEASERRVGVTLPPDAAKLGLRWLHGMAGSGP